MNTQSLSLPKTLNPPLFPSQWNLLNPHWDWNALITPTRGPQNPSRSIIIFPTIRSSLFPSIPSHDHSRGRFPIIRTHAGRSKKTGPIHIEGLDELRRRAKRERHARAKKYAESFFYRLKNPNSHNYADNFSEAELQMMGLGYDRMVRFMAKDDPNLRHPYDWYKYGEFGPYSWRGIVLGEPVVGGITDECVKMIGEVKDMEEWERIEQYEMGVDYGEQLKKMDEKVGFRHYWVFVRHPRWRVSELPWQQWTLVCEVALQAGKDQRIDKWNLMGRLGNKARSLITQCAAWMRPDILYVKRPVYQCRFEPQAGFFQPMVALLDPQTERDFMFEVVGDDGRVEMCTYFGGLCRIVKVNPKAFVDDVVNAYEKLSDEKKSKCLEFLLTNHPVQLLHPYTKEWKAKLEEMELGCDAPDDEDDYSRGNGGGDTDKTPFVDWMEDDENDGKDQADDDDDDDGTVLDVEGGGVDDTITDIEDEEDEESGVQDKVLSEEEKYKNYWDEKFKKAMRSNEEMEDFVKKALESVDEFCEKQEGEEEEKREARVVGEDGDELAMRGRRPKVDPKEWKTAGFGRWMKRIKKSKIPPELFLRAAVRPFTYRNLVKEIVLTRHAILDGEIGQER